MPVPATSMSSPTPAASTPARASPRTATTFTSARVRPREPSTSSRAATISVSRSAMGSTKRSTNRHRHGRGRHREPGRSGVPSSGRWTDSSLRTMKWRSSRRSRESSRTRPAAADATQRIDRVRGRLVRAAVDETVAMTLEFSAAIAEAADEAAAEAALAPLFESSPEARSRPPLWILDTCGVDIDDRACERDPMTTGFAVTTLIRATPAQAFWSTADPSDRSGRRASPSSGRSRHALLR